VLGYLSCLTFRNSFHTRGMLDSEDVGGFDDDGVVLWKVDGCFVRMDECVDRG
jgi:hypothetical protein